ncbi:MAG TPA: hypothetical protein VIX41_12590, partial [Acidimicrobiales bacterium]
MGDAPQPTNSTTTLGPNAWLVDEMYEQYLDDPASVSESWRDFFADYKRDVDQQATASNLVTSPPVAAAPLPATTPAVAPPAANGAQPLPQVPSPAVPTAAQGPEEAPGEPLRGAAA